MDHESGNKLQTRRWMSIRKRSGTKDNSLEFMRIRQRRFMYMVKSPKKRVTVMYRKTEDSLELFLCVKNSAII